MFINELIFCNLFNLCNLIVCIVTKWFHSLQISKNNIIIFCLTLIDILYKYSISNKQAIEY